MNTQALAPVAPGHALGNSPEGTELPEERPYSDSNAGAASLGTAAEEEVTAAAMPLRLLHVGSYNPREFVMDDADFAEFCETVRALGVYTPIIIRKVQGKKTPFEIVAGQRRYMAALRVFGPDGSIPYVLRDLSDDEALALATSENIDRQAMSPVEESQAAAKMVGKCNGDRAEAARRMGWSLKKLADRLKLMACSAEVRRAVIRKEISLGLGELLAGLKPEQQDQLLSDFKEKGVPSIEEAKAQVMQLSRAFTGAIFDQTECGSCQHNSAMQRSMFGAVEDGYCLNGSCFEAKTEGVLNTKVEELKDTYQTIRIIRPGETLSVQLVRDEKLGAEQAKACRSCQNYGAAVSGIPKSLGKVQTGLCYDTGCFVTKAKTFQDEQLAQQQAEQEAQAAAQASAGKSAAKPAAPSTSPGPKASSAVKEKSKPAVKPTVALTNAVLEFRDMFYRGVITRTLASDSETAMAFTVALLLNGNGSYMERANVDKVLTSFGVLSAEERGRLGFVEALSVSLDFDPAKLGKALPFLGMAGVERLTRQELTAAMRGLKPNLAKYIQLNSDLGRKFLQTLTKGQIEEVCTELGLDKALDKTFRSIMGGKKDDLIKQVTSVEGFEYAGKVPKLLQPDIEA